MRVVESSEPTYEGLKPGALRLLRNPAPRSEPTYEGLKHGEPVGGQRMDHPFRAYL